FADAVIEGIGRRWAEVAEANEQDVEEGRARGLSGPFLDRIRLEERHLEYFGGLARSIARELPELVRPGPVVRGLGGLEARRVPKPLGVVFMIYEAKPTVTVEGALVSVCSGNATILRGSTEIAATNALLGDVLADALDGSGLPDGMVQVLGDADRNQFRELLRRDDAIDLVLPRGSPSLVDYCRTASRIPVIVGGAGVNHLYVHGSADPELAVRLLIDSKLPEPAGCTALEMALVDERVADAFFAELARRAAAGELLDLRLRVPEELIADLPEELERVEPLAGHDDGREYLDLVLGIRVVDGVDEAIDHIRRHGSAHTEGIVGEDAEAIERFCGRVDAAAVIVNGSLRLHDGPTIGLGAELAISTGRVHVRGPVTIDALVTHSWRIEGNGAVRFLH
ncbi:MAG TPA: glutamate-5-semialdehyde dehydrogenase, partial [Gaiellaceae bacterium]|nr:glutamate-5-semialdehyde dehydrogenase [Gaiellaceae bacterium]